MFLSMLLIMVAYKKMPENMPEPPKGGVSLHDLPDPQRVFISMMLVMMGTFISLIDYFIWKAVLNPMVIP